MLAVTEPTVTSFNLEAHTESSTTTAALPTCRRSTQCRPTKHTTLPEPRTLDTHGPAKPRSAAQRTTTTTRPICPELMSSGECQMTAKNPTRIPTWQPASITVSVITGTRLFDTVLSAKGKSPRS